MQRTQAWTIEQVGYDSFSPSFPFLPSFFLFGLFCFRSSLNGRSEGAKAASSTPHREDPTCYEKERGGGRKKNRRCAA